ncbi:putative protein-lysine deacylase ABHD14B [Diadema antillarum]|uniref:putative protein-lysine deacylase ABHD14B n=1 Tax=Diadema antillarum TaxID=105358 RepID=UPI003A83DE46
MTEKVESESWEKLVTDVRTKAGVSYVEQEGKVDINGRSIFYRKVSKGTTESCRGHVLFLHAGCYSSQTWLEHGSMHYFASYGYSSTAIDMPGYGQTGLVKMDVGDPVTFMKCLYQALKIERPVIISPSRSGDLSIPLIMEHPELVRGYVPVSPHSTDKYTPEEYQKNQTQTLITYGENDTEAGRKATANLRNLPNHRAQEFLGAGHHPYMDSPVKWHQLVYNFVESLAE